MGIQSQVPRPLHQFKPIHAGHFDIRDHDLGLQCLDLFQRAFSVIGKIRQMQAKNLKMDQPFDQAADPTFVVYD